MKQGSSWKGEIKSGKQKFTAEEDSKLKEFVKELGTHSWKKIAAQMKSRTTRQCRERYINYLAPNVTNGPWTLEEDQRLIQLVNEMGPKWSKIALFFNSRSDVNVKNRYALFVSKGKAPPLPTQPKIKIHPLENHEVVDKKAEIKEDSVVADPFSGAIAAWEDAEFSTWSNDFSDFSFC